MNKNKYRFISLLIYRFKISYHCSLIIKVVLFGYHSIVFKFRMPRARSDMIPTVVVIVIPPLFIQK